MKYERFMVISDSHGDKMHGPTVKAALDFAKRFKPQHRIHLGDAFDFRWLRRSASEDEKLEQVTSDFQKGCWLLEQFKPNVFLWGNHDQRIKDAVDSNAGHGSLKALAEQWIGHIEDITPKCQHYPYDKRRGVHQYGDTKFLHGYCHGLQAGRRTAMVYGKSVMGHVHRSDTVTVERLDRPTCYICACSCEFDMEYNRANMGTLAQEQGWLYGIKTSKGTVIINHARFIDGKWWTPDNF